VEFFVKDTGTGMEPSVVKQLFGNNYYTSKGTANESGTGLGLMLCKDFLTRNEGTIRVESTVGKGSTFYVELPKKKFSS
jgi:signal transduction histidine kinase